MENIFWVFLNIFQIVHIIFLSLPFIMDKFFVHCSQVFNSFMDKFEDKITCYKNFKWKHLCVIVGFDKKYKVQIKRS